MGSFHADSAARGAAVSSSLIRTPVRSARPTRTGSPSRQVEELKAGEPERAEDLGARIHDENAWGEGRGRGNRNGLGQRALLQPPVPAEYESSRSTTKTRVEPAGINGEGDWLP
ncbi:hypothetical protein GCM10010451_42220 [Streptomyces virens]|uniref:Transposase n=1 Tax=Streptomyces virens TaxID=285572 RepID=A0ABP6PVE0_9ACTN